VAEGGDGDLAAGQAGRSETWRLRRMAEERLTPGEFRQLLAAAEALRPDTRAWLRRVAALAPRVETAPHGFRRFSLHPEIDVYRNPDVPASGKRLLVACSGISNRLMLPIVSFLQHLPSRRLDIVLLRDRSRSHYLNGIPGYAASLPELAARLRTQLRPERYGGLLCYGTSTGGFPALRLGLFLQASRAVSVGGRFPWHVNRLTSADGTALPAFDPLCPCVSKESDTAMFAIYSDAHELDRREAERLSVMRRVTPIAVSGPDTHNVVKTLFDEGKLSAFYDFAFELSDQPTWPSA
jgi:hypothetical protein